MQKNKTKNSDKFTKKIIRQNIKENKRLLKILFILQLLGIPAFLITCGISTALDNKHIIYYDHTSIVIFYLVFVIAFAVAFLLGIYAALKSFRYLHNKTQADKTLALPLSTSQRFAGSYLSGLIIYLIPYLVAVILSLILIPVLGHLSDGVIGPNDEPWILIIAAAGLLTMIMLYTTTVLTCSCCGSILESIVYTFLLNAGIPLFVYILNVITYRNLPGITPINEATSALTLSGTFGGSYKIFDIYSHVDTSDKIDGFTIYGIIIWAIKYIIIIAALIAISFFLYKKRKAEDISKPFVHSFIYFIFIITAVISIQGIYFYNFHKTAGIIFSLIMFITLDLIRTRGFKSIKKHAASFICYALSVAATFALIKISAATDGFGKFYYIPDNNNIKSIVLSDCSGKSVYSSYMPDIILTDKQSIEQTVNMHKETLKYTKKHMITDSSDTDGSDPDTDLLPITCMSLSYTTYTGNTVSRILYVPDPEWYKTLLFLAENDSLKKSTADKFDKNYNDEFFNVYSYNNGLVPIYSKFDHRQINKYIYDSDAQKLNELRESYRKDIMSVTKEDILDMKTYCMINEYYIPISFKNTISVLKKYKFISDQYSPKKFSYSKQNITICKSSIIKNTYYNSGDINTVSDELPEYYPITSFDNDLLDSLVKVLEPNYFTYEDCYIMSINKSNYIVPPKYSSLAEKFIDSSDLTDESKENLKKGIQK